MTSSFPWNWGSGNRFVHQLPLINPKQIIWEGLSLVSPCHRSVKPPSAGLHQVPVQATACWLQWDEPLGRSLAGLQQLAFALSIRKKKRHVRPIEVTHIQLFAEHWARLSNLLCGFPCRQSVFELSCARHRSTTILGLWLGPSSWLQ